MKNLASFKQFREEGFMTEWGDTLQAVRVPGSPPQFGGETQSLSGNAPSPMNYTPNDLKDPRVIDDINNHLERKLDDKFLTPYIGLERMRKVLHPYGIVIPAVTWLNGDEGDKIFPVNQFTGFGGMSTHPDYVVYMSWSYTPEKSCYDIYAALVTLDQLDFLLATDNDGTPFDDQDVEEDEIAAQNDMTEAFKLSKPSSGVDKFMDDYHATTQAHPWDNHTRILHNTMVKAFPHGDEIHLSDIQTLAPKSGAGTKALEHLKGLADKHGVAISGAAVPYANDKKYITSKKTLNKFYKDRGFSVKGETLKYSPKPKTEGILEAADKKPTPKEKHEAAIAKLLAYAPHITREQAIKQIGYDKELDKQAKAKSKMQRGVFGIR